MKKSVTLTELMLVISIIGVIMAVMIPALNNVKPDEITLMYRKTFFGIEEAVRNILNDPSLYPTGDLRYANGTPSSGETTVSSGTHQGLVEDKYGRLLCQNLAKTLNTLGKIQCPNDGTLAANAGLLLDNADTNSLVDLTAAKTNFRLTNGAAIGGITSPLLTTNDDLTTSSKPFMTLCVDVNGFNEGDGPNKGCKPTSRAENKRDQFRIRIDYDGKIYTGYPTGPNNWYLENSMLINPRSMEKKVLSEQEKTEIIKEPGSISDSDRVENFNESKCKNNASALGYLWIHYTSTSGKCVYTAGYTEKQLKSY